MDDEIVQRVQELETAVNKIGQTVRELEEGIDLLRKDGRSYREAVYSLVDKIAELKDPLVKYKNGIEEFIPQSEAIERTLDRVIKLAQSVEDIKARTELLGDIRVFIHSHKTVWGLISKRIYPVVRVLAVVGFALFLLFLIISFVRGDLTLFQFVEKIFD